MKKVPALAAPVLAAGLLAAGCGGEEGGGSGGASRTDRGAGSGAPKVSMRSTRYVPENVVVKRGGAITWTNDDPFAHTVTKRSGPGESFDSGTLPGGATYRRSFRETGVIRYVCTIHPNQRGTITVE